MTFLLVGLTAGILAVLYNDEELIADGLHRFVARLLARWGWRNAYDPELVKAIEPRGPLGLGFVGRFLYKLQDCPYCLSVHIAFWASWYALAEHPWHRSFWLTWWAGIGVAWLTIAAMKYAELAIHKLGAEEEARGDS